MHSILRHGLIVLSLLATLATAVGAQDRTAITQRVRAELTAILKKDSVKLPVDTPVLKLGADELDVVEWVMAVEEAFKIELPDEKVTDPNRRGRERTFPSPRG